MLCCRPIVCFLPGKSLKLPNFLTITITICNISMTKLSKISKFRYKMSFLRAKVSLSPIRRRDLVRRRKVKRPLTQTYGLPELLHLRYIFWEEMSWNEGVQWKCEIPPSVVRISSMPQTQTGLHNTGECSSSSVSMTTVDSKDSLGTN